MRQQEKLSKDLYVKRETVVSKIPNFWPLVFEQAPAEIDEYISPQDSALILNCLKSVWVDRFELPSGGDPRSVSIKFEFSENEYFKNTTLEKKFWWRHAKDGWSGLVSEPIPIQWKKDKDLTSGLGDLVQKVFEEDKAGKEEEETENKKALKKQMEETGLGGLSFFAWFGFRGRHISAEESVEAFKIEQEKRKARQEGKEVDAMDEDEEDDEEDEDLEYELEIFPTADDVAICISDDLWPGAIKYFRECIMDSIFQTEEDDLMEHHDEDDEAMEE